MCFYKNHSAYPEPEKFLSPIPCIDKRDNTACQSYNSISENSAGKSFCGLGFSTREKFSCIAETASQNRNDLTDRKYFSCKQKQENSNMISRNMTTEKFLLNWKLQSCFWRSCHCSDWTGQSDWNRTADWWQGMTWKISFELPRKKPQKQKQACCQLLQNNF